MGASYSTASGPSPKDSIMFLSAVVSSIISTENAQIVDLHQDGWKRLAAVEMCIRPSDKAFQEELFNWQRRVSTAPQKVALSFSYPRSGNMGGPFGQLVG